VSKKNIDLPVKLRRKMLEAGFSAHALEKKAGLKRSAVQNILYGKSKKPGAEILHAITTVLGCSMNELLEQHPTYLETNKPLQSSEQPHSLDMALYAKVVQVANEILKINNIVPNKQDALNYINEMYHYSVQAKQEDVDRNFAEWLYQKMWAQTR